MKGSGVIAILGTGRVGTALGVRLAALGHRIVFGSRQPERDELVELLGQLDGEASASSIADAVGDAGMVIVALPYKAIEDLVPELCEMAGAIVIDVSNALIPDGEGLMKLAVPDSSAERLQSACPAARVVKAFNTVGFHVMANPAAAGGPVTVPLAGNDADAKERVAGLVEELGFEPLDVGPLRHAHALEAMAGLYLVPYLTGRREDAFEFHFRKGTSPAVSSGVRPAE